MSLVALVFALIVFCFIVWAVRSLTAAFNVSEPLSTVLLVLVVLVGIVLLARALGFGGQLRI